jgi:hypothetical protein
MDVLFISYIFNKLGDRHVHGIMHSCYKVMVYVICILCIVMCNDSALEISSISERAPFKSSMIIDCAICDVCVYIICFDTWC